MVKRIARFEIYLVSLDPTQGSEMRKTRPCIVVSPDEMNRHIRTVIVAPMTTATRRYPTRVPIRFAGKAGQVTLDQIRTIDKTRLVKRLGRAKRQTAAAIATVLVEMFTLDAR